MRSSAYANIVFQCCFMYVCISRMTSSHVTVKYMTPGVTSVTKNRFIA